MADGLTIQVMRPTGMQVISKADYLKIPAVERTSMLMKGQVKFLDDTGAPMPASKALKLLSG